MREWLLKDEEKNKVGRPKLADNNTVSAAKKMMYFGFILTFILLFSFICTLKGIAPEKLLYNLTFEKIFGSIENKNGFIVSNYYDKNYDHVIDVKVPISILKYQGSYKYTLYKLKNNSWSKKEEKIVDRKRNEFKIKIKSERNKNTTWKIKLELVNASNIEKSFAPYGWTFVDSKENKKYAYNVFTVKGYYSPVMDSDINENDSNKISVLTSKTNPRKFIIDLKNTTCDVQVFYTDSLNKKNKLEKIVKKDNTLMFIVPNTNKVSYVTIKLKGDNLNSIKPNSWVSESKKTGKYIIGKYFLKPESSYNN